MKAWENSTEFFVQRESSYHLEAKHQIAHVLRQKGKSVRGASVGGLRWRWNRRHPHYGIWVEYPFTTEGAGLSSSWDDFRAVEYKADPPTYLNCSSLGFKVKCIADIAVQHENTIEAVIEIIHTHPTPAWKSQWYSEHGIKLFEVKAMDWVNRLNFHPPNTWKRFHKNIDILKSLLTD